MEVYTSEHEQVEALKRWWDKNGRSAIVGVVLVLLAVFGWRSWQDSQRNQMESASTAYQVVLASDSAEQLLDSGRRIVAEFPNTPYAALASLAMARTVLGQGDAEGSAAHLRWVVDNAKLPGLDKIARLRLARVQLQQGQAKAALAVLEGTNPGSFAGAFSETKGDVYLAMGERAKAREAYANALTGYAEVPGKLQLVQLKLDDLTDAGVAQ